MTNIEFLLGIHPHFQGISTAEPSLRELIHHYYFTSIVCQEDSSCTEAVVSAYVSELNSVNVETGL